MNTTEVRPVSPEEAAHLANNPPPELVAEANVFATDTNGFSVHFKLLGSAARIVNNLEVLTASLMARGYSTQGGPRSYSQPPAQSAGPSGVAEWISNADGTRSCSVHGLAKWVPPGVSKKTGNPYLGFFACQSQGCKPRGDD